MDVKSFKPKKQRRKYYSMPMHEVQKSISGHLDKALREKYGKRALSLRKGDEVKVMIGGFKGKSGKISRIDYSNRRVFIEKINRKKADGSEIPVPFNASNLLVTSLMLEDERRFNKKKKEKGQGKKVVEEEKEKKVEEKKEVKKSEGKKDEKVNEKKKEGK